MKKLHIAIIGCGPFARHFVPLFKLHPYVEYVGVCDLIDERAQDFCLTFGVPVIPSFEEALADERIDCIANFTQRHLHGDIVTRALKAGKHVWSAVPMASEVEECREIVRLVKETGLKYMMAETCYYYPCAMFCREMYREGRFGNFVYGASQYYHHIDVISYGKRPMEGGMPPLLYPTHSTGMILSAANSHAVEVACFGYSDSDERFKAGNNYWDNEFSNQYMLLKLANGGTARVTEGRRFGWAKPSSYISAMYGDRAGYEFSNAQHIFVEKDFNSEKEHVFLTDVSDYVNPAAMVESKSLPDFMEQAANGKWQWNSFAKIQEKEASRLPTSFEGAPNGHMASHQLLVDDFCRAVYEDTLPVVNAWEAARYTIPGLVGIESAKAGGAVMEIPDCGDAPV